jgi:hypothetical protein
MKVIDAESYERGPVTRRPGFFAKLLDAFLLRDAETMARRLPEPDAQGLSTHVARTRQKLESARLLWAHEQYVEGLRLAEESVVEVLRAAEAARGVLAPPPPELGLGTGSPIWADVLVALGATSEDVQDATVAMGGPLGQRPAWNGDLRPEHRRFFRSATRVTETALERLLPLVAKPAQIVVNRWIRIGGVVAVLVALLLTSLSMRRAVEVRASASFDEIVHEPSKVHDGNPATEWLLPTKTAGWVEVGFRPRTVTTVKVLNSHNPPYDDRATREFRVEGYRGGQIVHSSKHSFTKVESQPTWLTIAIPGLRLDAVRIVVENFHKVGGGLAEIVIE